ncbi:flippase-like domain-containing protein [Clostridium bovifaecis]|uniref:Phosphatidylglycerol lysyltransferase n=1 Tax=Clostridium bovifaecis TaxID=2184719 RepID=A0A6I6EY51_9CLOT|nr:flippase-like domain-containing protein [Clostridium bovifaecis]
MKFKMKREKLKDIFNIGIIIVSASIFLIFAVSSKGLINLVYELKSLNYSWIFLAVIFMLLYWIIESTTLHIFAVLVQSEYKFYKSFKTTMIGQFFSAITPFSSGGQPAQIYYMIKSGISGGAATSILAMKFIMFQGIMTIYSIIAIIVKLSFFQKNLPKFTYICVVSFSVNTMVVIFLIFASTNKRFAGWVLSLIYMSLSKIKLIRNPEKILKKLEKELISFHDSALLMTKNYKSLIETTFLTILQLTCFFSIPYFIYRSFNASYARFWDMIFAQTFLTMVTSVIPLPGASGGAEGGFYLLFGLFFDKDTIISGIILWRIITYYLAISVGGIFTIQKEL